MKTTVPHFSAFNWLPLIMLVMAMLIQTGTNAANSYAVAGSNLNDNPTWSATSGGGTLGLTDFKNGNDDPCLIVPTATISGDTNVCAGDIVVLQVALTGTPNWSYTWSDGTNTGTVSGVTTSPSTFTVTPASDKIYTIISVSDQNGCIGVTAGSADVKTGGPRAFAPAAFGCLGSVIDIPITVASFSDVGSVSLTLKYNKSVMTYNSFDNNSGFIDEIEHDETGSVGIVRFSGISGTSFSMSDGETLLTLKFDYLGGASSLDWDDSDDSWCEFASGAPNFFPYCDDVPAGFYYTNGSVTNSSLTANFSADNLLPPRNTTVKLTDLSTGGATGWLWSFDPAGTVNYVNGTVNTSQNPEVQFTDGGTYTCTLTVTNAHCSKTEVKTAYIHAGIPGLWTGDFSSDWYTATNWDDHLVPGPLVNVVIPTVPTGNDYPLVTGPLITTEDCYNIELTGDSELTIQGVFTLNDGTKLKISGTGTVIVGN